MAFVGDDHICRICPVKLLVRTANSFCYCHYCYFLFHFSCYILIINLFQMVTTTFIWDNKHGHVDLSLKFPKRIFNKNFKIETVCLKLDFKIENACKDIPNKNFKKSKCLQIHSECEVSDPEPPLLGESPDRGSHQSPYVLHQLAPTLLSLNCSLSVRRLF